MRDDTYETLDEWTVYAGQTAERMELVQMDGHKVRFHVRVDNANPSKAYAQIWNPAALCWNHLTNLPSALVQTPRDLGYRRPDNRDPETDFNRDLDRLTDAVEAILF